MWTTVARPSLYDGADEEEYTPPTELGYEYTSEGFKTINADWTDSCPFQTIASKDPVNFEEGIYMQFRIDAYDFSVGPDKWISVSFWDSPNISQGSTDRGSGISTLIRPTPLDDGTWEFNHINWYNNAWTNQGYSNGNVIKVNDEPLLFEVELKIVDGLYELYINGAPAPALVNSTFVDKFVDGEAYILISLHNTKVGSNIGLTITKFGTSKATATVPQGDDKKEPVNVEIEEKAPIADPTTVPENMPAILMTGNREMSDAASFGAGQGDDYQINDDFTVRIIDTSNDIWTTSTWRVKSSVSYDIDDFPVMCFLTKNFCTCDDPTDCYATEECKIYLLYGENIAPAGNNVTPEIDICWEPIIVEEGEKAGQYLYFWYDSSTDTAKEKAKSAATPMKTALSGTL
jgi:hypothetical protein